jgi:SNF2 family DNA or RNA helicase
MNREFIVGIVEDNMLGFVLKPFVINKLENKGFYPIEAQVSDLNFSGFEDELNAVQQRIFHISQEYSEKNLSKIFSKKKKQTTKDFFAKLTKEFAREKIRPFIEKRHARIIDELRNTQIPLYFKDKHKFINRSNFVCVLGDSAQTVFNIIKEEEGTRYYLSINQNGSAIYLKDKTYFILSSDPCRIIVDDHLYSFDDINAGKLKPFFEKEDIIVPKSSEEKWFSSFALPNIKKYSVNAEGFEIELLNPDRKPVLSIEYDLNYQPSFCLLFYYGTDRFYANAGQKVMVHLNKENGQYKFTKIKRNPDWEKRTIQNLKHLGLINYSNSYFTFSDINSSKKDNEALLYEFLRKTKNIVNKLEEKEIALDQSKFEKDYTFLEPEIDATIEEENDWFDIKAIVKIGDYSFPFIKLKRYVLDGIREVQLPDATYAILPEEWFSKYADLFKFGQVDNDRLKLKKHHFKILENSLEPLNTNYLERLQQFFVDLDEEDVNIPEETAPVLRSYQADGFRWMSKLHKYNFGGCLADDMGLGKTLQTLTLLLEIKHTVSEQSLVKKEAHKVRQMNLFEHTEISSSNETETKSVTPTHLIVMPTSLVHNWENEINTFTPQFSVYRYIGLNRTKNMEELYDYDIILTSYGIVRNDFERLSSLQFYYIILDESQHIKNPSSKTYKAVNELTGKSRLVLTGTPIENSLSDLWAQLNFLNKGLLGNYNFFKNEFIYPIEKYKDDRKKVKLQTIIAPFLLRRTKYQVAKELPDKTEQIIYCEMTEDQSEYYESEKSKVRNSLLDNLEEEGREKPTMKILEGLSVLRQTANHPVLVDENYNGDSGKFEEVIDYIHSIISEEHKVLVFSSYKKHLNLLSTYFKKENWNFSLLTGETQDREKAVNEFQDNHNNRIFLIQIKAGGFGLNLTAADYVLILDPWWNPAVEDQAVNRAHRIGQDKNVMVYRFISVGTVEEKIQKLQNKKARLAETFVTPSEGIKNLSKQQILELFS